MPSRMQVWSTIETFSKNSLSTHLELAFALVEIVPENIIKNTLFPLCLIEQYLFRFVLKFCKWLLQPLL